MTARSRLSCSEFSFPTLAVERRLELVRLLGFESVDLSLFLNTEEQVAEFLCDPRATTQQLALALEGTNLEPADLFLIVGGDNFAAGAFTSPLAAQREHLRTVFQAAVGCARDLGARGMTILPGLAWAENWRAGWQLAVEELRWRVEQTARHAVELRIEPHIGSIVSTPEMVVALIEEVAGLRLSLDAGHFTFQAIGLDRILRLVPFAGHIHISGARPGGVHVPWKHNVVDFPELVGALEAGGFTGQYCIEYVPMDKWGADATDIVSAVVTTRDFISTLLT